jgi:hypothetical protein
MTAMETVVATLDNRVDPMELRPTADRRRFDLFES